MSYPGPRRAISTIRQISTGCPSHAAARAARRGSMPPWSALRMPAAYMSSIYPFTKRAWRGARRGRKLYISSSADPSRGARKLNFCSSANRLGRHTSITHPKSIRFVLFWYPGPAASGIHQPASPPSSVHGVTGRALWRSQRAAWPQRVSCKVDVCASAKRFATGNILIGNTAADSVWRVSCDVAEVCAVPRGHL